MSANRFVVLKSRPAGKVSADDFEILSGPVPEPEAGQVLIRNLYLSIDPGVRNLLGAQEGYLPPIPIGAPMSGSVLGVVLDSRHSDFRRDDLLIGRGTLGDHSVIVPGPLCWKVDPDRAPSLSSALGVLGNTGRTAYFGLLEVGRPQPGETVLVSGAAGGVGSLVGQIARIKGCRAVGIAGGEEKRRRLIEEFGFDAAVDYRGKGRAELSAAIAGACPDGVDVFFDNVGGPILDAALPCMNSGGRAALCGMISQYDGSAPPEMENLFFIIARSLRLEGFLLTQFAGRYDEAVAALSAWIADGRLRYREEVAEGLEQVVPTFLRLFDGTNQGKTMVKL
ncbi:MAG: NADP-dependent oxidoreductase [Novosphingobium sp.]